MNEKFGFPETFESKKTKYFIKLGLSLREVFKMHKLAELWNRENGKKEWGNVSEHCIAEAARAKVFAEKLELSEDLKNDLVIAAALHDFWKKFEIQEINRGNYGYGEFEEENQMMKKAGFSERIIHLVNSVGVQPSLEVEEIARKENLSENDIAYLIMHYVDDYTIGSDWAKPSEIEDGKKVNDMDRRFKKGENNPVYANLGEEGKRYFNGKSAFEIQREVGVLVEKRLAELYNKKTGQSIDQKNLPEIIDEEIKKEIGKL